MNSHNRVATHSETGTANRTSASRVQQLRRSLGMLSSLVLVTALGFACANPNAPPGGPPDVAPPRVLKITPGSGTVGARPKSVVFQFDEVISETPKGQQNLAKLVFISPRSGDVEVDWRRNQLDIKPSRGWKPNTVYTVLLSEGVTDLRNNSIDSATRVVFSTGGPIPETKIEGVVFDWTAGRYAPRALIEAIVRDTAKKDSTIYQTISDSLGRYSLQNLPPGNYVLRGIADLNANRLLERLEPWDTVGVSLTSNSNIELYAFPHDTTMLNIRAVAVLDSNKTLRVTFDKPITPAQAFSTLNFTLRKKEKEDTTTAVNITTVFSAPQRAVFDSLKRKATEDSMARLRPVDTTTAGRARADSIARQKLRDSVNAAERQRQEERRLLLLRGGRPLPPRDTTPPPKMRRAPLYNEVFVNLERPLDFEGRYVLTFRNITSVAGVLSSSRRGFAVNVAPKPKAQGDSANSNTVPVKR